MKIIVEPGSYHLLNVGDVAMMQISNERLNTFWPNASIQIVTAAPDLLRRSCPTALPIPAEEREGWVRRSRHVRSSLGALARRYTRASIGARRFADRLAEADLLLVSGSGFFTHLWEQHALSVLDVIDAGLEAGVPTALVGQGIGPLRNGRLRDRMAQTLPAVDVVALRERLEGPSILRSIGVDPNRILVTGDDAIELAHRHRSKQRGTALGVNIRKASYVGLEGDSLDELSSVLRDVVKGDVDMQMVPIVVSPHSADPDLIDLTPLVDNHHRHPSSEAWASSAYTSPEEVVREVAKCRVVLATTYHAAVFAVSQGIPVVAITATDYYRHKFGGLTDLFGEGVQTIDLADESGTEIREALTYMWKRADELRGGLLDAAQDQIARSHSAYERVRQLVERCSRVLLLLVLTPESFSHVLQVPV